MNITESKSEVNLWLSGTDFLFNLFKGDCIVTIGKKEHRKKIYGLLNHFISDAFIFDLSRNSNLVILKKPTFTSLSTELISLFIINNIRINFFNNLLDLRIRMNIREINLHYRNKTKLIIRIY